MLNINKKIEKYKIIEIESSTDRSKQLFFFECWLSLGTCKITNCYSSLLCLWMAATKMFNSSALYLINSSSLCGLGILIFLWGKMLYTQGTWNAFAFLKILLTCEMWALVTVQKLVTLLIDA